MMSAKRTRGVSIGAGRMAVLAGVLSAMALPAASADCKFKRVGALPVAWEGGRLTLSGSINDTPMRMVVDTGAEQTVVSGALAERLKLPLIHVNNVQVGVGGRSEESMSRLDEFSLGRFQWHRTRVGVAWNAPHMPDVLVGAAALFERDVELTATQLAFFVSSDCGDSELGYWADGVPWVATFAPTPQDLRVNITVQVNGVPVRALVDSGAPSSVLDSEVARSLGFDPDDPARRVGTQGGIGDHVNAVSVMTLDTVAIGAEVVRRPRMRVADLWGSARHDMRPSEAGDFFENQFHLVLGADFIRAHHLLFANSQRRLYFSYIGGDVFEAPKPPVPTSAAVRADAASAPLSTVAR